MKASKCNTINLAKISLETLKKRTNRLQKISKEITRASFEQQCIPQYIPPPPRAVRSAKIQICRPQAVDFVPPPVPCICPPCPICPSRGEQIGNLAKIALKAGVAYFLFEVMRKKGFWGPPDGTSRIMMNFSNFVMKAISPDPKGKNVFGGDRISLIEMDRIKYTIFTWWDKAIVFLFTWSIGAPLQFAHDIYEKIELSLFPEEEDDKSCPPDGAGKQNGNNNEAEKANGKGEADDKSNTKPTH